MDRKAWIVIIFCVIGIIASQWWSQKEYHEKRALYEAEQARLATEPSAPVASAPPEKTEPEEEKADLTDLAELAAPAAELAAPAGSATPGEVFSATTAALEFEFNTLGGGISRLSLLEHEAENGERVRINTSRDVPIGSIGIKPEELGRDRYLLVSQNDQEILFEGSPGAGLKVRKRYLLPSGGEAETAHRTKLEITFENSGEQTLKSPGYFISTGSITPIHERDLITYTGVGYFTKGKKEFRDVNWFKEGRIPLIGIQTRSARPFLLEEPADLQWLAVRNQYYASILHSIEGAEAKQIWARRFDIPATETHPGLPGIEGALGIGAFDIPAGQSVTHTFELYTGPQKYAWLKALGDGQEEILNYGIFKVVSLTLLSSMNWLNKYLGSYALAIIVLTLIIKSLLWPLQNKATNSMRKMSALSPKMTELREKYKDDPTRMNQELMKLYKDYGVNPFGGCLPMLVQIPIFFGFYSMLGTAIELRNSKFFWVKDLSQPDTVATLAGIPVNVLPLVMAFTMLWQMKITPKTGDAVQQRIFLFMPLIFLVFCYNFASALALYWTVQNLFSIVQLYLTRDKPIPALTKVAAPEPEKKRRKKR